MVARVAFAAVIVLALVWPRPLSAEVVELTGGEWVEGRLKEASPSGVVVEVGGQTVTFPADRVVAIYFKGASQGAPAQPAPAAPVAGSQPGAAAPAPPQPSAVLAPAPAATGQAPQPAVPAPPPA